MSHLFTAIVAVSLILGTALSLTLASLSSADQASVAWASRVERGADKTRTALALVAVDTTPNGIDIDVTLRNSGQTVLRGFEDWDVIAQYYKSSNDTDLTILSLSYTTSSSPSHAEWTDVGIYNDAKTAIAEVYDPGVLNPLEEVIFKITIDPAVAKNTSNRLVISTPNGVSLEAPFSK